MQYIQRRIRSDDVVDYLTEAILRGQYKPGDKVVELHLVKSLNVSQTTIREALRELRSRGFLETHPFKGTHIRNFTVQGLRDYFRVRTELEVMSASWSSGSENGAIWDSLGTYIDDMARHIARGDVVLFCKTDLEFHRAIAASSGNRSLLGAWEALWHVYWAYIGIYMEQRRDELGGQPQMHMAIAESARRGDFAAMRDHLNSHYIHIDDDVAIRTNNLTERFEAALLSKPGEEVI
jgi:DNA-binding GntR family transcriptional regulator